MSSSADPVAARLATEPLEVVGRFGAASNVTLLCRLGDGPALPHELSLDVIGPAEAERLCVYKPRDGEAPLWDFPDGTLHRREVAAYEIDRALGWGLVPPTVLRADAPYGPGAVQAFVAHDPERHYFWMLQDGPPALADQLRRMVVFDLVIDNADRKGGHVLLARSGRIQLVDHGVSLAVEPKLRTVAWHFAGEPIPGDVRPDLERLRSDLGRGAPIATRLGELLSGEEVERLAERIDDVLTLDALPEPAGPRPFPWPLL